jgi:lysyl-tRNA synthetase class I
MFMNPQRAKKLHFDVIPQHVDDFLKHAEALTKQTDEQKMDNPAWHITQGKGLLEKIPVSFSLLLNLAAVCNPDHKNVLWAFISQYADGVSQDKNPYMDKLCELAVRYYNDFVKPNKNYHVPNDAEKTILLQLKEFLATITPDKTAEEIQNGIYDIGMKGGYSENLKDWFKLIYMVLLGSTQGPRMGSFVKLYGRIRNYPTHREKNWLNATIISLVFLFSSQAFAESGGHGGGHGGGAKKEEEQGAFSKDELDSHEAESASVLSLKSKLPIVGICYILLRAKG